MDNKEVKYLMHVLDARGMTPHLHTYQFDPSTYITESNIAAFLNYVGPLQRILYIQELIFIDPSRIPDVDIPRFQGDMIWMIDFTGGVDTRRYHQLKEFLTKYKIKPYKIHILVNTNHDVEVARSIFPDERTIITEVYYGQLIALREICAYTKEKRFLSLIRNFNQHRFFNFVDLHRRGILQNSYFSFFNIKDVYGDRKDYYSLTELDQLFHGVTNQLSDQTKKEEMRDYWSDNRVEIFSGMPYSLPGEVEEVGKIAHQVISRTLNSCFENSYFSLLTETHMYHDNSVNNSYFSLTEKTSKSVYYRHPFVIYSDANFLKRFRQSGYKTFSSVVDESYDEIMNPLDRILAINDQVSILNKLDIVTFKKRMFDLNASTAHNYKLLIDHYTNIPSRVVSTKDNDVIKDIVYKNSMMNWF